jgi:hypothetical protein
LNYCPSDLIADHIQRDQTLWKFSSQTVIIYCKGGKNRGSLTNGYLLWECLRKVPGAAAILGVVDLIQRTSGDPAAVRVQEFNWFTQRQGALLPGQTAVFSRQEPAKTKIAARVQFEGDPAGLWIDEV